MAERSRRGIRRQVSDTTDDVSEPSASESEIDWDPRKSDSARRGGRPELSALPSISRSKRAATDDSKQSIRLTMKVAPSKLREVMRANEVDSLQDTLGGGKVIDGPRSRRAAVGARASTRAAGRPKYAEFGESDIEDEDEEEDEEEEDEAEDDNEEAEDEEMHDFEELSAEVEAVTDDEDVDMDDAPPPPARKQNQPKRPKITLKAPPPAAARQGAKTKISVKPPNVGPLKSVEDQEIEDEMEDAEDAEDDEQSSELSEDEDATNLNEDAGDGEEELVEEEEEEEDAEGEGEDRDIDDDEDPDGDEDDEDDSGNETPASGTGTPDPARLTKRQRGRPEDQGGLMALDMAPQQRKFFTAEEKAMKKDEHARKRKELTKRKINEEKAAALNRLLKPQASKARGAAPKPETLAAATAAAATDEYEILERVNPLYVRWVSTREGVKLGVPEEWLGKNAGKYFGPPPPSSTGLLIQEME